MTDWAPCCSFQEGLEWPCGRACGVGLRAPREQGLSWAFLCPGSRPVPWVEEVVAPVGSSAAACWSCPLGRPPPFSAALWMKCPDRQGPAGRGLVHAWNSPCSGIHVGQAPGSGGRVHLLAASGLCLFGGGKTTSSVAGHLHALGEERGQGPGVSVVVRLQRGCGRQGVPSGRVLGPAWGAPLPCEAPLAVRPLHCPDGRWWAHCCPRAALHLLYDPLGLGFLILLALAPSVFRRIG